MYVNQDDWHKTRELGYLLVVKQAVIQRIQLAYASRNKREVL
jgi:hypothetical protein